MPFRARRSINLGIVRLNFTQRGFSSWTIKLGPWSFNSRTRRHTVDTPGPGSWHNK